MTLPPSRLAEHPNGVSPVQAPLMEGALDIVGDVHGELEALQALLRQLGYGPGGDHPDGRHLVFVGDLCDRGADSGAVVQWVADRVSTGRAQCVLGNHELNLLLQLRKQANGWFFGEDHDRKKGRFTECTPATEIQRQTFLTFFASLPLTLARADLRVVHAAWHPGSLAALGAGAVSIPRAYSQLSTQSAAWVQSQGLGAAVNQAYREWGAQLTNPEATVPLLPALGQADEHFQMSNPIRVLTSGVEQLAQKAFYASGKWRMVTRVPWWNDYRDAVPVVFGHYWRRARPHPREQFSRDEPDLFAGAAANQWVGPRQTAFCVDFSVGMRYQERPLDSDQIYGGRLGAVRWPEQTLVFDDGQCLPMVLRSSGAG